MNKCKNYLFAFFKSILFGLLALLIGKYFFQIKGSYTGILVIAWCISISVITFYYSLHPNVSINYQLLTKFLFGAGIIIGFTFCISGNLDYDESYSFSLAGMNISNIIKITSQDVHPPLYYIVLSLFVKGAPIFPVQIAKISSLIFYIGYLLLIMLPCRKIVGEKLSCIIMFFSVVMPCMIVQSGNLRMYSFTLFFTTLTAILAYYFYQQNKLSISIAFVLCSLASMYTHSFTLIAIFIIYCLLIFTLIKAKKRKEIIPFFVCGAIVAVSYLPWLPKILWQASNRGNLIEHYTIKTFWIIITEWFSSWKSPLDFANLFYLIVFVILIFSALYYCFKERWYLPLYAFSVFIILVAVGVIMSLVIEPCFLGRYAFCCIGLLIFTASYGFIKIKFPVFFKGILITTFVFIAVLTYKEEAKFELEDGLVRYQNFLDSYVSEDDLIMLSTEHAGVFTTTDNDHNYMRYGGRTEFMPFPEIDGFTEMEQLDDYLGKEIFWVGIGPYSPNSYGINCIETKLDEFMYQGISFTIYKVENWP